MKSNLFVQLFVLELPCAAEADLDSSIQGSELVVHSHHHHSRAVPLSARFVSGRLELGGVSGGRFHWQGKPLPSRPDGSTSTTKIHGMEGSMAAER